MKKSVIALFIVTCCLSAYGQFFSKEEQTDMEKGTKAEMKTNLTKTEQKAIYIELCEADATAETKAGTLHTVKIHHTPEQRKEHQQKADDTKVTLLKHYKGEIAKKHHITEEYLAEIIATGEEKKWPKASIQPTEK